MNTWDVLSPLSFTSLSLSFYLTHFCEVCVRAGAYGREIAATFLFIAAILACFLSNNVEIGKNKSPIARKDARRELICAMAYMPAHGSMGYTLFRFYSCH